ncbi:MAG TPA: DUF3107 domain-containing protein [Acidimicrobiales bacterium]|nr:DUF3107 domain-containing protein [Acidimicrobiales bacterium]
MEVRIGVTQTPKELEIELAEGTRDQVVKDIEQALADGEGVLWLTDRRGRTVGVPSAKVAYIEITPTEDRRVGFAAT